VEMKNDNVTSGEVAERPVLRGRVGAEYLMRVMEYANAAGGFNSAALTADAAAAQDGDLSARRRLFTPVRRSVFCAAASSVFIRRSPRASRRPRARTARRAARVSRARSPGRGRRGPAGPADGPTLDRRSYLEVPRPAAARLTVRVNLCGCGRPGMGSAGLVVEFRAGCRGANRRPRAPPGFSSPASWLVSFEEEVF
jgi:hypothetical protein